MFLLRCPQCKHTMKYQPQGKNKTILGDRTKQCVYCGKAFKAKNNVIKEL